MWNFVNNTWIKLEFRKCNKGRPPNIFCATTKIPSNQLTIFLWHLPRSWWCFFYSNPRFIWATNILFYCQFNILSFWFIDMWNLNLYSEISISEETILWTSRSYDITILGLAWYSNLSLLRNNFLMVWLSFCFFEYPVNSCPSQAKTSTSS